MATPITAPIAGNQNFSLVTMAAAQLPLLNVTDLEVGNATTNSLRVAASNADSTTLPNPSNVRFTVDSFGHLTTAQQTPPTGSFTGAITANTIFTNSTDCAGQFTATGTAAAGDTLTVTFNRPYGTGIVHAVCTACNDGAATASSNGYHVVATSTGFTLTFLGVSGANPCFNYFVIDAGFI